MSKKRILIIGAIAVGLAAVVIANLRTSYEGAIKVDVEPIKNGRIVEKVSGPGVIYAESSVKVSSSIMGRITHLAVQEGADVKEGDVLLQIDPSQYEARVKQAEAAYKASLARIDLARARLDDARGESNRVDALSESGLVSERDVSTSRTNFTVAGADLQAAIEASGEAKAGLLAAQDDLDKTVILAPISGTVTTLNAEEGEIVITGTMNNPGTVVMTISNLDTMEVRADIDETDVAKVRPGQDVEISVDAFADTTLAGLVSVVGSSSSSAQAYSVSSDQRATFEVRMRIIDHLPGLRPGMATTVDVVTAVKDSVPYVPIQALVSREVGEGEAAKESEGLFLVADGRSKFMPISTGISDDKNIEILDAIAPGSDVIVGPFKVLRDLEDSTKVKPIKKEK